MAAKLTRLTHKTEIQLQLVAESCTICSSRSRRPVRKLLDTPSLSSGAAVKCSDRIIPKNSLWRPYGTDQRCANIL